MKKEELLDVLMDRFTANGNRHKDITWAEVESALEKTDKIDILIRMEESGGEVDVVKKDAEGIWFFDCAAESPKERRSVCYDEAAWNARKTNKPESSMEKMAGEIGAEILNKEDYMYLQSLGDFDLKSQCWLKTEEAFRKKGDGLYGNKRHGRTFIYYNGVQSYYSTRGFRCKVVI